MTKPHFTDCFKHFHGEEEEAAEVVHCLKKFGEQIYFDDNSGRLVRGREKYDPDQAEIMKSLSNALGITDRKSYEQADRKYNLTMY